MIEAPQHPFGARHRPQIIGRRQHQHREQAGDIDRDHGDVERAGIDRGQHDQCGGGDQPERDADEMNDAVGDQLGTVVVPQRGAGRVDRGRGKLLQAEDRHAGFPVGRWTMGSAGMVTRSIPLPPYHPLARKGAGNVKLDFGPIIATLRVIARPFWSLLPGFSLTLHAPQLH
ncbi:hypothetical protein AB7M59_004612 [Bradyrhizobium elkanii]